MVATTSCRQTNDPIQGIKTRVPHLPFVHFILVDRPMTRFRGLKLCSNP